MFTSQMLSATIILAVIHLAPLQDQIST